MTFSQAFKGLPVRLWPARRAHCLRSGHTWRKAPVVAHVVFRLDVGGLENGLVNLINNLPSKEFAHVIICLTGYNPAFCQRFSRDDVRIYSLGKREGKDFLVYWRFWKLIRRIRPAIVHTRNLGTLDLLPVAAFAGVPIRVHGEHGWDIHDIDGRNPKYRWMRRIVCLFANRFIALSCDLQEWLIGTVGLPSRKVTQIYNGVDTAHFYPVRRPEPGDAPVIVGTVSRMEPVKNPVNLAEAFVSLCSRRPELKENMRLVMVGEGSLLPEVQRRLETAGVSELVEFAGTVGDVRKQLHRFDLFVLPSRNEGISNTVLEAMACGLPVVATNVGGNAELIIEEETGVLVAGDDPLELAEAIARYVTSPSLRCEHGAAGRQRAERLFSLASMVSAYRMVYREMLGLSKPEEA